MICGDHTPFVAARWGHHLNLAKNTDCTGLLKENAKQGPSTRTLGKQNADDKLAIGQMRKANA